jgi:hypothetical protein
MYYVADKETYFSHTPNMVSAHYIELPDGRIFVKAIFKRPEHEEAFAGHALVLALPSSMTAEPVGDTVATALAHIGVNADHKTWEVAARAAKIHPQMRLR